MVHGVHYAYGLQFSFDWANIDWAIYFFECQGAVLASALIARSLALLLVYEAFVLTATQDLIFYGLWHNFLRIAPQQPTVFPTGDWTWMPLHSIFGIWTTTMQFTFSLSSIVLASFIGYWLTHSQIQLKVSVYLHKKLEMN